MKKKKKKKQRQKKTGTESRTEMDFSLIKIPDCVKFRSILDMLADAGDFIYIILRNNEFCLVSGCISRNSNTPSLRVRLSTKDLLAYDVRDFFPDTPILAVLSSSVQQKLNNFGSRLFNQSCQFEIKIPKEVRCVAQLSSDQTANVDFRIVSFPENNNSLGADPQCFSLPFHVIENVPALSMLTDVSSSEQENHVVASMPTAEARRWAIEASLFHSTAKISVTKTTFSIQSRGYWGQSNICYKTQGLPTDSIGIRFPKQIDNPATCLVKSVVPAVIASCCRTPSPWNSCTLNLSINPKLADFITIVSPNESEIKIVIPILSPASLDPLSSADESM